MSELSTVTVEWDTGEEWPCESCGEMRSTIVGPTDIDPPTSYCGLRDYCPVDIAALRELEAEVELARKYLAGAMRVCTVRKPELLEVLSEVIAEALSVHYCAARVGYDAVLSRVVGVRAA